MDRTFPSAAGNLACDEALLDACESGGGEVLRFWESPEYFVVVGFSNEVAKEVHLSACRADGIPVLRRCSGGGTVLQGEGCLNYSVVLEFGNHPGVETITGANRYIMERQRAALAKACGRAVEISGCTDLAIDGQKFSGNAQRRQRRAILFHGTFLLRFDLNKMDRYLNMPSRQPDYRAGRPHGGFVMNTGLPASAVKDALRKIWQAEAPLDAVPDCGRLIAEKYARDDWNLKF